MSDCGCAVAAKKTRLLVVRISSGKGSSTGAISTRTGTSVLHVPELVLKNENDFLSRHTSHRHRYSDTNM